MFKTIVASIPRDPDYSLRSWWIEIRMRLLDGSFYDGLAYDFHEEMTGSDHKYIPLDQRRPSVRSGLLRTVVDDCVSLLFDQDHFPEINLDPRDEGCRGDLQDLIRDMRLNEHMMSAATIGATGSVCLLLRILAGRRGYRPFVQVMNTRFLTPVWDPQEPDQLLQVVERYKVLGSALAERGYAIEDEDLNRQFWFEREWDALAETWFLPWRLDETDPGKIRQVDPMPGRTTGHGLGFVPMVWIKDLPGGTNGVDGASTLSREAIDTVIQIDYLMSQGGRGLKYSQDPLLLMKEPTMSAGGEFVRSASNAIIVGAEGDAKMLEIDGSAADAVVQFAAALRAMALEALHGNRSNADKLSAATSGRAMELMNQALIWLAGRKRVTYGDGGLAVLLRMVARASETYPLTIGNRCGVKVPLQGSIGLRWPSWYAPSAEDRLQTAQALKTHIDSSTLSQATAIRTIAADYQIENVAAEQSVINRIPKDKSLGGS